MPINEKTSIAVELNGENILKILMAINASKAAISIPPRKLRSRLVVVAYRAKPLNTTVVVTPAINTTFDPATAV